MNNTIKLLPNGDFEVLEGEEARRHEAQLRHEFEKRVVEQDTSTYSHTDVAANR